MTSDGWPVFETDEAERGTVVPPSGDIGKLGVVIREGQLAAGFAGLQHTCDSRRPDTSGFARLQEPK